MLPPFTGSCTCSERELSISWCLAVGLLLIESHESNTCIAKTNLYLLDDIGSISKQAAISVYLLHWLLLYIIVFELEMKSEITQLYIISDTWILGYPRGLRVNSNSHKWTSIEIAVLLIVLVSVKFGVCDLYAYLSNLYLVLVKTTIVLNLSGHLQWI